MIHTLMSEFSPVAEREGFVVAFPQGQFDPVRWNASPTTDFIGDPNDDLTFVDEIIDSLGRDLCLDRTRVYAAGLSCGAITDVAARLCALESLRRHRPGRRAAPARSVPRGATGPGHHVPRDCRSDREVQRWLREHPGHHVLRTTSSPGDRCRPERAGHPGQRRRNGRRSTAVTRHRPIPRCRPRSSIGCTTVPPGADVEFYIVLGGGHAWPGSEFSRAIESVIGYTTFDINATELAWSFFQQFQLPCP